MPLGIGVDIIEVKRFRAIGRLERVAELVLTEGEYREFARHPDPALHLASRFALKEAVIKACPARLTYRDIEIRKKGIKPDVRILGGLSRVSVLGSLSHSTDYVAGFAEAYLGPTQNGDLHVFLPNASGSGTSAYGFPEIIRAEKRESHPFA